MQDEFEIPGLSTLESTPEILRGLLANVTEEQSAWKPSPEAWSIAEVLEHLSHIEGHMFRSRAERIVEEDDPDLAAYDEKQLYAEGQYSGRSAEDSFDHFEEQREDNLEWLSSLDEPATRRPGQHEELGTITLEQILHHWAFHDLGHIRQIASLVRMVAHYPGMGPFQRFVPS